MATLFAAGIELALWLFILRTLAEFILPLEQSAVGRFVHRLSEPILLPVRRLIRPMTFGEMEIDLSPVVVVLVLYSLQTLI